MAAGARNIKVRKRLSELYKKGVEVRIGREDPDDPSSDPVGRNASMFKNGLFPEEDPPRDDEIQLWVQPPSPMQREQALRNAQASRARALVRAKRDTDSEEHLTIMAFLADMGDDTLIDYVLAQSGDSRRNEAQRDVLADDKWENITALQDSMREMQELPAEELDNNDDWQALLDLDREFGDQLSERIGELTDAERVSLSMLNRATLEKRALEKRADLIGSQAFMSEYERQMLFYSIRDFEEQGELFFESARESSDQDEKFQGVIKEALLPYIDEGSEAKNSPRAEPGSEQSGPPKQEGTSESSIPEAASA